MRLGLLAQRLRLSDRAVIMWWMLGRAIEGRVVRWQYQDTVVMAARDEHRVFWTVHAPEKINL